MDTSTWGGAITAFQTSLRAADRSEQTIWLRGAHLWRLAAAFRGRNPWKLSHEDLAGWLAGRTWATETRRSHRATLRGFYAWGEARGHVAISPARDLPAIKPAQPQPRPTPEHIYRHALKLADDRQRIALRLGAEAGLRRGEMVLVNSRDLVEDLGGWSLRVHGKGRRQRLVPLTDSLAASLRVRCGLDPDGWAFPGQIDGHLSPAYLAKLVSRLLPEGVTTHSLRHLFGTRAYAVATDLLTVQALLGHASPDTTQRYVKLPNDALRRTVVAAAAA